jgi:beta-lactamase regulating signal transducer with metallopeptidase domain
MPFFPTVEDLSRSVIQTFGNTLLPGIALVLLVETSLRVFRKLNASAHYVAWLTALILIPLSILLGPLSHPAEKGQAASISVQTSQAQAANPQTEVQSLTVTPTQDNVTDVSTQQMAKKENLHPNQGTVTLPTQPLSSTESRRTFSVHLQPNWALYLFVTWLVGVTVFLGRLIWSYLYLHSIKRNSLPLAVNAHWADELGMSRIPSIRASTQITVPMLAGFFAPMILIPHSMLQHLTKTELEQVILHEMAHTQRRDDWTKFLQRLIQALFFFHPAIWWISEKLDFEREVACDDWVLSKLQSGQHSYASSLVKIFSLITRPKSALTAAPMMTKTKIERRIHMILDSRRSVSTQVSKIRIGIVITLLVIGLISFAQISPAISLQLEKTQPLMQVDSKAQIVTPLPTDKHLYWFNMPSPNGPDGIQRTNADNTSVETAVALQRSVPLEVLVNPYGLVHGVRGKIQVAGGQIYWSDPVTNQIKRSKLDGTEQELVLTAYGKINELEVDLADQKVYWAETPNYTSDTGVIRRANLDGSDLENISFTQIVNGNQTANYGSGLASSLVVDPVKGKIFWAVQSQILCSNLDGSNTETVATLKDLRQPFDLALDHDSDKIYWTLQGTLLPTQDGMIQRISASPDPKYGWQYNKIENVVAYVQNPMGLALSNESFVSPSTPQRHADTRVSIEINDPKLYWIDSAYPKLQRSLLDGSQIQTLYAPRLLEESSNLSMTNMPCGSSFYRSIIKIHDGEIYYNVKNPGPIKLDLNANTVQRFSLKSNPQIDTPVGAFDIDWVNRMIYAVSFAIFLPKTTLTVASLDDNSKPIFTMGLDGNVSRIVLDLSAKKIYWISNPVKFTVASDPDGVSYYKTDLSINNVRRSNLDGSNVEDLFTIMGRFIDKFDIDGVHQKIYWLSRPIDNENGVTESIGSMSRANLDSSNIEENFTKLHACSFTLDPLNGKIYLGAGGLRKVFRENLDGTEFESVINGIAIMGDLELDLVQMSSQTTQPTTSKPSSVGDGGSP